ncbi:MAG: hypothetical protein MJ252_30785, partial [archaeon]|nr:hypothetical protein [archaeon]
MDGDNNPNVVPEEDPNSNNPEIQSPDSSGNTHFDVYQALIDIDECNKKCCDCGNEDPTHVSINNGIVLCSQCAMIHSSLGYSVSYVREILDPWDDHLMAYMLMGSNSKFKRSMDILGLDNNLPINEKYKTCAVDYYRRNLKNKVINGDLKEIDYEDPNAPAEITEKFIEFENYVPGYFELEHPKEEEPPQKKKGRFGIFGAIGSKIVGAGKTVGRKVKSGATFVAHKAQPVTNKVKSGATFVAHKA